MAAEILAGIKAPTPTQSPSGRERRVSVSVRLRPSKGYIPPSSGGLLRLRVDRSGLVPDITPSGQPSGRVIVTLRHASKAPPSSDLVVMTACGPLVQLPLVVTLRAPEGDLVPTLDRLRVQVQVLNQFS